MSRRGQQPRAEQVSRDSLRERASSFFGAKRALSRQSLLADAPILRAAPSGGPALSHLAGGGNLRVAPLIVACDVLDDLGSRNEVDYVRTILERGTSADRQLKVYRRALSEGASEQEAIFAVVDHLIDETAEGWRNPR